MRMVRFAGWVAGAATMLAGVPASAQFYLQGKDLRGARVVGDEPGIGQPLPGATPAEVRANVVWNMRAALNVAALQCQFEPTLLTRSNYNAILSDHKEELAQSYETLSKYFVRVNKTKKEGQSALDQFGTKTYSSFATVSSQFNFCSTANDIGRQAIFAPRGTFGEIALDRLRELRNSLTPWGDQFRLYAHPQAATLPRFEKECWSKDSFNEKKCGQSLVPVTYASR